MGNLKKTGKLLSVNWQDGMMVKSAHFDEQEEYFEDLARWTLRNNPVFYGLTRPADMSAPSFDVRVDHDGQNWVVVLSRCFGFTASGRMIQIDGESDDGVKTAEITSEGPNITPVYVHATGLKKKIGMPAEKSLSTRHPYRCFEYRLIVGEAADVDPADCLKIAEIVSSQDKPGLSMDFIPPCSVIGAHPTLSDYCYRIKGILTQACQSALSGYRAFIAASQAAGGNLIRTVNQAGIHAESSSRARPADLPVLPCPLL
jgi:hypothetical protein